MNFFNPDANADVLDDAVPEPVPVHADVQDTTYTVDLDLNLDLDFNLNFSVNSSVTFDYPIWTESDIFSKELTDSILTENFTHNDKENNLNDTFTSEQLPSINNDTICNPYQGLDQFYYGDITDYDDTNTSAITTTTNDSDVFIFQVEPVIDSSITTNKTDQRADVNIDSFFESYGFDVPKDSLFELDLFNECLNDTAIKSECSNSVSTDLNTSVIDWNRRRSLIYDKNEFTRTNTGRRSDVVLRVKPPMCSVNATKIRNTTTVEPRTYKCSVRDCQKTYCKASHLKSHMRRHSGVKPFACDWDGCKWRFSRSDELARHKRSHSGVKPYTCNLCEKAFSRSDHLSKHAKVHMKKLAMYGTPIITKKCNYKYLSVNRIKVE